jgi:hypothetical protein
MDKPWKEKKMSKKKDSVMSKGEICLIVVLCILVAVGLWHTMSWVYNTGFKMATFCGKLYNLVENEGRDRISIQRKHGQRVVVEDSFDGMTWSIEDSGEFR